MPHFLSLPLCLSTVKESMNYDLLFAIDSPLAEPKVRCIQTKYINNDQNEKLEYWNRLWHSKLVEFCSMVNYLYTFSLFIYDEVSLESNVIKWKSVIFN